MCEENQIEGRQLARPESRSDVPLGPEREWSDPDADASAQRGIREDPDPEEVEQHRGVSEPRERELVVSPLPRVGFVWRGRDRPEVSFADTPYILEIAERNLHVRRSRSRVRSLRRELRGARSRLLLRVPCTLEALQRGIGQVQDGLATLERSVAEEERLRS